MSNEFWGYCFLLMGLGVGILFIAFAIDSEIENIILSAVGIISLILAAVGIIILVKND